MSEHLKIGLWGGLVLLVLGQVALLLHPFDFLSTLQLPFLLVLTLCLALFALIRGFGQRGMTLNLLLWIGLACGLALRGLALWILQTDIPASLGLDLFAGRSVLEGQNPYAFSPEELLGAGLRVGDSGLETLRATIENSSLLATWLDAAVTQGLSLQTPLLSLPFLAFSNLMMPEAPVLVWGFILLGSDVLALLLMLTLMRQVRRASGWVLLFWLNPIWLILAFGQGSSFVLLAPLMTLVLWASVSERSAATGIILACTASLNLWLSALLPLMLRSAGRRPQSWRRSAYGLVGFSLFAGLIWVLHLMFGAPLHWFASVNGEAQAPVLQILDFTFLQGMARFSTALWILSLFALAAAFAFPPLPDQAQRTVRAGFVGFVMILVSSFGGLLTPLALVVLLPLSRSPAMVLATGFSLAVALLSPLVPALPGLGSPLLAQLLLGLALGFLFVLSWFLALRRHEPLE